MKNILLTVLLILLINKLEARQVYTYSHLLDKYDDLVVLDIDRKEVSELPYGYDMEVCTKDSNMHCFKTKDIWFAVPDKSVTKGQTWVHDDIEYQVVSDRKKILGMEDVYLIEAQYIDVQVKTVISSYLYSNNRGLILINITLGSEKANSLILNNELGFPK